MIAIALIITSIAARFLTAGVVVMVIEAGLVLTGTILTEAAAGGGALEGYRASAYVFFSTAFRVVYTVRALSYVFAPFLRVEVRRTDDKDDNKEESK